MDGERPDWFGLYSELSGYLQAAVNDDAPVDAGELLVYLGDLRIRYVHMTQQQFLYYVKHEIFNPAAKARIHQEMVVWYLSQGNN